MQTIDELKVKLLNAQNLAEKIAIRIEMIELTRHSNKSDYSLRPLSDMLDRIHAERNSIRLSLT